MLLVVYNPSSGGGRGGRRLEELKSKLAAAGLEASFATVKGRDWEDVVKRAVDRGDELVVAAGGDGTVNAVAGLLVGTQTTLGVLPAGTLNHFAGDAGIPAGLDEAVQVLISGRDTSLDTAAVNGQLFLNNSSIGLYPSLVRRRERHGGMHKPLATMLAAFESIRSRISLPASLTIGSQIRSLRTSFIFVGNNDYQLGRHGFTGRTNLRGGHLAVYAVHHNSLWAMAMLLVSRLLGSNQAKIFDHYKGTRLDVRVPRDEIEVAYDGEVRPMQPPLVWELWPASLKVRLPK